MSFPYKESLKYFENLSEGQVQMYNDSADSGVRIHADELSIAREHLRALKKFYGGKNWTLETSFKQAAVNNIIIPMEQVGRDTYNCTVLSVNCSIYPDNNRKNKPTGVWLSVSLYNSLEVESNIAVFRR